MAADVPEAPARFLEMRAASADPLGAFEEWAGWARENAEHLRELARDGVERVQEMAISAWDNLVAAMSPLSDFAMAEREAAEEREAELDRAIDEVLAEMDLPEPHTARGPGAGARGGGRAARAGRGRLARTGTRRDGPRGRVGPRARARAGHGARDVTFVGRLLRTHHGRVDDSRSRAASRGAAFLLPHNRPRLRRPAAAVLLARSARSGLRPGPRSCCVARDMAEND